MGWVNRSVLVRCILKGYGDDSEKNLSFRINCAVLYFRLAGNEYEKCERDRKENYQYGKSSSDAFILSFLFLLILCCQQWELIANSKRLLLHPKWQCENMTLIWLLHIFHNDQWQNTFEIIERLVSVTVNTAPFLSLILRHTRVAKSATLVVTGYEYFLAGIEVCYVRRALVMVAELRKLSWIGHMARMDESRHTRNVLRAHPYEDQRQGRPRRRCIADLDSDLKWCKITGWTSNATRTVRYGSKLWRRRRSTWGW